MSGYRLRMYAGCRPYIETKIEKVLGWRGTITPWPFMNLGTVGKSSLGLLGLADFDVTQRSEDSISPHLLSLLSWHFRRPNQRHTSERHRFCFWGQVWTATRRHIVVGASS